jgi:hypothetical protein
VDPGDIDNPGDPVDPGDIDNLGEPDNLGAIGAANVPGDIANAADPGAGGAPGDAGDIGVGAGNDPRVGGLPIDESGRFYFDGDGAAPLEVRLDIPFEEFRGLSLDGQPLALGEEYTARSGSTVLTVAAERLKWVDAGMHTLSAVFASETVEIAFDLRKTAPSAAGLAGPPAGNRPGIGVLPDGVNQPNRPGWQVVPVIAGGLIIIAAGASLLNIRIRKSKGAKSEPISSRIPPKFQGNFT